MRSYTPFILPAIVLLFLIGLFARGLFLDPTKVKSPLIGKPAPAFSLPRLRTPDSKLEGTVFLGKVSLLNVWGSWCASCQDEHPVLVAFAKRNILPIYGLDYHDDRKAALAMLDKFGDPYAETAYDESGDVAINWGVYGAPETFLIDKRGVIRDKIIGPLTPDIIDKNLMPEILALQAEAP